MSDVVARYWSATEKRQDGYKLIADRYQAGASYHEISSEMGCGYGTIKRALVANGVTPRPAVCPKGARSKTVRRPQWARVARRKPRVACGRCGLLLKEFPGRGDALCCLCCEDLAKGLIYGSESRDDYVRWAETIMRASIGAPRRAPEGER